MEIYLEKVKKEFKDVLYRLLQYSLFEESISDGNEMNEKAEFEYKNFDSYFEDPNYNAFFIKENRTEKLLGFVMINTIMKKCTSGHSIAEFMIIPKYRRNKIGKKASFECFEMFHGNWEVSPSIGSKLAFDFWKKVIDEYTNNHNEFKDGVFVFRN